MADDRSPSADETPDAVCRSCVYTAVKGYPHICEGSCNCKGLHRPPAACGEIINVTSRVTEDVDVAGDFL